MKIINKEIKIFLALTILALVFLFSFNIVYAYFTSYYSTSAEVDFYKLEIKLAYQDVGAPYTEIVNQKQLFPSTGFSRNKAVALKSSENSKVNISGMGFSSSEDSTSAYVRFWLEVYSVKQTEDGTILFIDSEGNYLTEDGVYTDENGVTISSENVTAGEIVDYSEYFELGYLSGSNFSYSSTVARETNVVNNKNYVTYFLKSAISGDSISSCGINSIRMTSSAPNEILDSHMIIFISMEGVQSTNKAYKSVFNDNHGYYQWEK